MNRFFRRASQPLLVDDRDKPDLRASSTPFEASSATPPLVAAEAQTLRDTAVEDEMFAGRCNDDGRTVPAHLRAVMAPPPMAASTPPDLPLKPSERFARPQGLEMPSFYSTALPAQSPTAPLSTSPSSTNAAPPHVSAGKPSPAPLSPPAMVSTGKKAGNKLKLRTASSPVEPSAPSPPAKSPKRGFFRFGAGNGLRPGSPSLPQLPSSAGPLTPTSPVMPAAEVARPRREGRPESMLISDGYTPKSSPMPTPVPEHNEPAEFFAAAQEPSSPVTSPVMNHMPFDRDLLQGYSSAPDARPSYLPPNGQPLERNAGLPLSASTPAFVQASHIPLPRAVSHAAADTYSPLAAFLAGTRPPAAASVQAPAEEVVTSESSHDSPTGTSETDPAASGERSFASFDSSIHSTPATSECGGPASMPRPRPPTQTSSNDERDELLALYDGRDQSGVPSGQSETTLYALASGERASSPAVSRDDVRKVLAMPTRAPPPPPAKEPSLRSANSVASLGSSVRPSTSISSLRTSSLRPSGSSHSLTKREGEIEQPGTPFASAPSTTAASSPTAFRSAHSSFDFAGPYHGPPKPWMSPPASPSHRPLPSAPSPLSSPSKASREPLPAQQGSPRHPPLPMPGSPSQHSLIGQASVRDALALPPGAGHGPPTRVPSAGSDRSVREDLDEWRPSKRMSSLGAPAGGIAAPAPLPQGRRPSPGPKPLPSVMEAQAPLQPAAELRSAFDAGPPVVFGQVATSVASVITPSHSVQHSLQAPIVDGSPSRAGSHRSHASNASHDARQRIEQIRSEAVSPSAAGMSTASSVSSSLNIGRGGSDADVSSFAATTEPSSRLSSNADPESVRKLVMPLCVGKPRFEHALATYPRTILATLLAHLEWHDVRPLREVSHSLRVAFDVPETRELVLERYLGKYGYRTHAPTPLPKSSPTPIELSLRDLEAFLTGREFAPSEFAELAREHVRRPLDLVTLRMIRASMRAWNRLVMRCRVQGGPYRRPPPGAVSVYKEGRAACLRVWVPLRDGNWMNDEEVVACEKEVWRAGVWSLVQKCDLVWNVAQGDFANEGKLMSDGRFLRDLSYSYDHVGHLPTWINAMTLSPGHFHGHIASSDPNHPVIYTTLAPFSQQIQQTLVLLKENVEAPSPQGRYRIQRYLYRANVQLRAGTLVGSAGGAGNGPGGIDAVHPDWAGHLVVETEGTSEHAQELMRRCTIGSEGLSPFRIVRERSRPGKLVIRPVLEAERVA